MDVYLVKKLGSLCPATDDDTEKLQSVKSGQMVLAKITRPRNAAFHRKYMALLNAAFGMWEPKENSITTIGGILVRPAKNFDRFRKDIAIATGNYDMVITTDGDMIAEARSISFAKMDEDDFAELYSMTIDYILEKVVNGSKEDIENQVNNILSFD